MSSQSHPTSVIVRMLEVCTVLQHTPCPSGHARADSQAINAIVTSNDLSHGQRPNLVQNIMLLTALRFCWWPGPDAKGGVPGRRVAFDASTPRSGEGSHPLAKSRASLHRCTVIAGLLSTLGLAPSLCSLPLSLRIESPPTAVVACDDVALA